MDRLFSKDQIKDALILKANNFRSSFCRNDGNGKFTLISLPSQAQISIINGMTVDDYDNDGNLDIVLNGNDWGTEVSVGRYDALNGLLLKGDGKGNFVAQSIIESGIYIPGNGKALVSLKGKKDKYLLAAGQNRGPLKIFELNSRVSFVSLQPDDVSAELTYKNGIKRKLEFYYGSSFLSQSGRFLKTDETMKSINISKVSGEKKNIEF
jgi:hypothetical protein